MEILLVFVVGLAAGIFAGFFWGKSKSQNPAALNELSNELQQLRMELAARLETLRAETERRQETESLLEKEREQANKLIAENSSLRTEWNNTQQRLQEHKQELTDLQQQMTAQFKNLANEIFEEKSQKFTDQNKVNIGEMLNPLKEKLGEFEKKVEESNKESLKWNSSLSEQIRNLKELNQQITKEAENLTRALKGDTKAQGNWGEYILESILEKSGLQKGREYLIQESTTVEAGRLRPDVVVKLPESKHIIIDSKVSLLAYEQSVNAEDEDARALSRKSHLQSVKNHIKQLSAKEYQNIYGVQGLDYVLMFVPIEPAFSMALQSEPELFQDAMEKRIVIVSPTTLLATLRTIASIWRSEYQNRNVLEIARQAGEMYDKFASFSDDLIKLGHQMETAQKTYGEAMGKLSQGRGNLVKKAENLKELGARASKQVNAKLVERASEDLLPEEQVKPDF